MPLEPAYINTRKNVPGPGTYGFGVEINKKGVYVLSNISNSRAANWSPSKKRFEDEMRLKKLIPGPGTYNPSDYNGGQYLLSNFKSYGTRKMVPDSRTLNNSSLKTGTPGPGTYEAPSEFGNIDMSRPSPRGRTANSYIG